MTGRLYVVATPIGHLSDLSPRAAETLRTVDVVAAEDTRVTRVLLRHVGSSAQAISAHAHNQERACEAVLAHLHAGRSVALVSDAGTPAISDPGNAVVAAAHGAVFVVTPIPGPSAVATLLSAAGLSDGPFLFEGFLPARPKVRDERLARVAAARGPGQGSITFSNLRARRFSPRSRRSLSTLHTNLPTAIPRPPSAAMIPDRRSPGSFRHALSVMKIVLALMSLTS